MMRDGGDTMCNGHHGQMGEGRCCPTGGRVRGFIQPWLLLLLLQKPSHGYELMDRLAQSEEAPGAEPGLLYRTLHQLEEEGLVRSAWDTEGSGPARKLYQVTPEGVEYLHAWAVNIRRTRARLDSFLKEYETHFQE
ncbi:MAG: PadR family transcriptional regulator [candidate division WOR-3 bacterium]